MSPCRARVFTRTRRGFVFSRMASARRSSALDVRHPFRKLLNRRSNFHNGTLLLAWSVAISILSIVCWARWHPFPMTAIGFMFSMIFARISRPYLRTMIGDLSHSINKTTNGRVQDELIELCDRLEHAEACGNGELVSPPAVTDV